MASLLIKDLPEDIHRWIKAEAAKNHRSMTRQIVYLLDVARRGSGTRRPSAKAEDLLNIGQRCARLPDQDSRDANAILGYDADGLPG